MEVWIGVTGFPNTEVSNLGRVRSLFRGSYRIRSAQENDHGYMTISLQNKNFRKRLRVHRLVAEAFLGPSQLDVNHKDGNKKNNCIENLEYMTRSENCKHSFRLGLSYTPFKKRGSEHINSKLTESIVLTMRQKKEQGESIRAIATAHGVSYYTVWDIIKRRSWTHI